MPPIFVNGEYLNAKLAPILTRELQDDETDFLQAIPDAPDEAIGDEGLRLMMLKETAEGDINPAADYDENDVKDLDHDKALLPWDTFSTKPMRVTKAELRAAIYDKRAEVRSQNMRVLRRLWRDYCIDKLAPVDDANVLLPVMRTTGELVNGRRRLRVQDIITYRYHLKEANIPKDENGDWNIRLCNDHELDLLLETKENQDFRDHYHDPKRGEIMNMYEFNFWFGNHKTYYDQTGAKKAMGAIPVATDMPASIFWNKHFTVKKFGYVTAHLDPMSQDTRHNPPREEFRLTGYGQCTTKHETGTGALVSDWQ